MEESRKQRKATGGDEILFRKFVGVMPGVNRCMIACLNASYPLIKIFYRRGRREHGEKQKIEKSYRPG